MTNAVNVVSPSTLSLGSDCLISLQASEVMARMHARKYMSEATQEEFDYVRDLRIRTSLRLTKEFNPYVDARSTDFKQR